MLQYISIQGKVIVLIDSDYILHTAYLDITATSFLAVALGTIHNIFMLNHFASTRIIALLGHLVATEVFVSRKY